MFDKNSIKDLRLITNGRQLKDIIIVDNKEAGCFLEFENLIPIHDFLGDISNDKHLVSLCDYLLSFKDVPDVRKKITEDFRLSGLIQQRNEIMRGHEETKKLNKQNKIRYKH